MRNDPIKPKVPETFETPRLLLRTFRSTDAPQLHEALVESLAALRTHLWFLPWVAGEQTLQSAELRCRKARENFELRTDLPFLAFARDSGRLVGSAGLHRTDWTLPQTEVGYWIRSSEVGKGYASEAVTVLVDWAFAGLGAKRVELVTDECNAASRAVAVRCGFRLETILHDTMQAPDGQLRNACLYARLPAQDCG